MASDQIRTYSRAECAVFSKTKEGFGGLSNMAGGFPLRVNGIRILTSEALYQACRFPHLLNIQRLIIQQNSPMTAKMKGKPYRDDSRPDWDRVRVKIMRWCLRVKLVQNWNTFSALLLKTGERPIVEESRKDDFWGAKAVDENTLVGMNVLGRLLMELRELVKTEGRESFLRVEPLAIPDFRLEGRPIEPIIGQTSVTSDATAKPVESRPHGDLAGRSAIQPSLFGSPVAKEASPAAYLGTKADVIRIADLKAYPEYKDTGLPWLGELPAHWIMRRAKYLFREIDERSLTGKEVLLSVSHMTGVTPRSEKTITMFLAKSNVGHKLVRPNDLVINTLWAWMAALGVTKHAGIVSPAYGVYRPLAIGGLLPQFADQLLRTPIYAAEYLRRSTGVNSSRMRLYPEQFLRIPLICPPADEQAAIVRFLHWMNRRLERAIQAKRKELALVSEMLFTVTQQSLALQGTRDLRLSTVVDVMLRPIDRRPGRTYTPIGLYNRGRGIFHKANTDGADLGDSDFFCVEAGDLVISGQFAWEGAVALARATDSGCVASHRYPILRGCAAHVSSSVLIVLLNAAGPSFSWCSGKE
jgi:type I restriction enzyme S subunit